MLSAQLRPLLSVFFPVLLLLSAFSAFAAGPSSPSSEGIEDLLGIMESPTKREAFTRNLKNLLETKKAMEAKEGKSKTVGDEQLFIVRLVVDQFDGISEDIRREVIALGLMIEELPEAYAHAKNFFLQTKNRAHLRVLLLDVAAALLAMLLFGFFLKRPIRSTIGRMKDFASKIGWGLVYMMLKALPFAVLFILFDIMFRAFPSFPKGRTLALLLFALMFCYQLLMAIFQILLSPDQVQARLAPLSDENANYLWIWTRRFALYAFFYVMITRSLVLAQEPALYFSYLRGFLLLPFPLMLTVFVFQVAREFRMKYTISIASEEELPGHDAEGKNPKDRGRLTSGFIRCWPVLAMGYVWAIFLSLMVHYEKGFQYLFHATFWTVLTALMVFVLFYLLDSVFTRLFRIKEETKRRFPGLEKKANRYLTIVKKGAKITVLLAGMGAVGQIWGIPVSSFVASGMGTLIILRAVAIAFTVAAIAGIIEVNNTVAGHLLKEKRRGRKKEVSQKQKTLIPVIQTAINIAAGFVGGIIVLERLGVNTTPILAGAGIIGLAVGFGSQTLVKDLISGLFILFEESIRVGDWAMVGTQSGAVESVGLRTVKLRDMNGTLHVISNSTIDSLSNFSKVFSRTVMDIGVAYREDVDEVIELLKELGEALQKDPEYGPNILEPLEIFGLDRFEDSAVIIRARFKTKPLKQWGVRRAFYRLMKRAFDERGIEIPFPHRTVYMGEPKEGKAPPLHVDVQSRPTGPESG